MILILAALCVAGWLCALLKCRVERALPLLPALGMLVLVPLAMARALWLTDLLSALLIGATAMALIVRRGRLRELGNRLLTPGLLAFAMLIALSYFATRGRVVWEWDEYSYWALKVKELLYYDGVQDSLHTLTPRFGDYLPGAQTLLWWTLRATGGWNESTLYFAMMVLNLTYLLPLTERLSWRRAGWLALLVPVMVALPTALSSNIYVSLGVDTLLGMQMGYLLYLVWERRSKPTKLNFVSALLTLCAMTLTKQVGLLWGGIALGFGAVIAQKGERASALLRALLLALPAVVCLIGWKVFCGANGLQNYLSAGAGENLSWMNGLSWFMPLGYKTFLLKTLKAFLFAPVSGSAFVSDAQAPFGFSVGGWMLLFCAGFLFLHKAPKRAAAFWAAVTALFLLAFCFSFLTLFRQEIQIHADNPKRIPASLERYCCPMVLGLGVFFALLAPGLGEGLDPKRMLALGLGALSLLGVTANYRRIGDFLIPSIYAQSHPTDDATQRYLRDNEWILTLSNPAGSRVLMSGCGYYQYFAYAMAPASAVEMQEEDWTGENDEADFWRFVEQNGVTHVMLYGDWGRVNPTAKTIIARSGGEAVIGRLYEVRGKSLVEGTP